MIPPFAGLQLNKKDHCYIGLFQREQIPICYSMADSQLV